MQSAAILIIEMGNAIAEREEFAALRELKESYWNSARVKLNERKSEMLEEQAKLSSWAVNYTLMGSPEDGAIFHKTLLEDLSSQGAGLESWSLRSDDPLRVQLKKFHMVKEPSSWALSFEKAQDETRELVANTLFVSGLMLPVTYSFTLESVHWREAIAPYIPSSQNSLINEPADARHWVNTESGAFIHNLGPLSSGAAQ